MTMMEITKQPSQKKTKGKQWRIVRKPNSDDSYSQTCLALIFENIEFLWQRLEESALADTMRVISLTPREDSSVVKNQSVSSDSDHAESKQPERKDRRVKKAAKAAVLYSAAEAVTRGPRTRGLQKRNENILVGMELTARNLSLFNSEL